MPARQLAHHHEVGAAAHGLLERRAGHQPVAGERTRPQVAERAHLLAQRQQPPAPAAPGSTGPTRARRWPRAARRRPPWRRRAPRPRAPCPRPRWTPWVGCVSAGSVARSLSLLSLLSFFLSFSFPILSFTPLFLSLFAQRGCSVIGRGGNMATAVTYTAEQVLLEVECGLGRAARLDDLQNLQASCGFFFSLVSSHPALDSTPTPKRRPVDAGEHAEIAVACARHTHAHPHTRTLTASATTCSIKKLVHVRVSLPSDNKLGREARQPTSGPEWSPGKTTMLCDDDDMLRCLVLLLLLLLLLLGSRGC